MFTQRVCPGLYNQEACKGLQNSRRFRIQRNVVKVIEEVCFVCELFSYFVGTVSDCIASNEWQIGKKRSCPYSGCGPDISMEGLRKSVKYQRIIRVPREPTCAFTRCSHPGRHENKSFNCVGTGPARRLSVLHKRCLLCSEQVTMTQPGSARVACSFVALSCTAAWPTGASAFLCGLRQQNNPWN
jgi:hypothetical protein